MNVTENYLLQQMQTLAASMSNVPQTGGKDNKTAEGSTFQDMMNQAGKTSDTAAKDTETKEPVKEKDETEAGGLEEEPVKAEEELKPEQLTANPNAVNILDLFRPDMVQPAEEPVIEMPVEAIPETGVEGPELGLDGQLPEMETGVEANVESGISMEQQPETFQETLEEVPQERPAESAETVEAPAEAAPERVENADKPQTEAPKEAEVVQGETDEEPKAEAMETEQPVFHETQSTPVKVGETYETVDTEQPEMEQKLTDIIQAAAQNGSERVEIRLAPQNLGSLTIEMAKDANGALQVVLHASNAKAAGVLNQHLDGLQAALRGYSQEEVRIEVQRNDESQQQNFRQADPDGRGNQQRQQQERREEEHTGDAFMQKLRLGLFGADAM
ncbi:MAG: hypothetical protein HFF69_00315 [Oscillospiraceae bacterium]|jgi:flagellar hook-length control protein FliK|nr:hypothetical protein [Oscillospiraceae bacterium]